MNKRKLLTLALALCMVAILAVGGTLAYLTDTDQATNTFTVGNVDIKLNEYQRAADGEKLEDFKSGSKLSPIVGSAQGEKDKFGLATAKNYVDKIVTVTVAKGSDDAYVRVYYAIPTELDNVGDASKNVLHVNDGNRFVKAGNKTDGQAINPDYTAYMGSETTLVTNYKMTVNNQTMKYNIYYRDYNKVMAAEEETGAAFIVGLYLDQGVDTKQVKQEDGSTKTVWTITRNGKTTDINYDFTKGVAIPVYAVGVQAAGFESCADAVNAAFGANYNPWASTTQAAE